MLPILSADQMKTLDSYSIKKQQITSLDLMERAANKAFEKINDLMPDLKHCIVLCGNGNNGGDGWVLARLLHEKSCKILVIEVDSNGNRSKENKINRKKAIVLGIETVEWELKKRPEIQVKSNTLVIDALFGFGLSKKLSGIYADLVQEVNTWNCLRLAIDLPSGLTANLRTEKDNSILISDYTLTFQLPKLNLLNPDNAKFIGELHILNIGLEQEFIQEQESVNFWITKQDIQEIFPQRKSFESKRDFGNALLITGSKTKAGAAILATKACLRSGAGLTTVHLPVSCQIAMNISAPEAMLSLDENPNFITELPDLKYRTAIGIGPGIEEEEQTKKVVEAILKQQKIPKIIDADALNILAENKKYLSFLNEKTILTPHEREFDRLTKVHTSWSDRINSAKEFVQNNPCVLVLKAPHTMIFSSDGKVYYNSTGNVGLAKGGSGDVLTGIITSYLAQGISPLNAAIAGVFNHGLTADLAIQEIDKNALLASDLIHYLTKLKNALFN
jgi:NAD(P)H-hydrate epimerase